MNKKSRDPLYVSVLRKFPEPDVSEDCGKKNLHRSPLDSYTYVLTDRFNE